LPRIESATVDTTLATVPETRPPRIALLQVFSRRVMAETILYFDLAKIYAFRTKNTVDLSVRVLIPVYTIGPPF
jgi:hypothetical protein